jgi:hypothetical protein
MFDSVIIDVAIGIIFIFILVSIICTTIREGIEATFKSRAAYLEHGIRELLHDRSAVNIAQSFFTHPLIKGLFSGDYKPGKNVDRPAMFAKGGSLPSYIPSKSFAMVLMDIAARGPVSPANTNAFAPVLSVENIRANISNIQNEAVQRILLTAIDSAQGDLDLLQKNIEAWFNGSMDRVSGWYKRTTQRILFVIALVIAVGLNVNTITISDYLYHNKTARSIIVARAEAAQKDSSFVNQDMQAQMAALDLPIGWGKKWETIQPEGDDGVWNGALLHIFGWLLTALAATLGAPFWFDLLNKIMVLRSSVKPVGNNGDGNDPKVHPPEKQLIIMQQPAAIVAPEHEPDGCDVAVTNATSDIDLPTSEGGIA